MHKEREREREREREGGGGGRGHHLSVCTNGIVCREYKQEGHKKGDAECNLGQNYKTKTSDTAQDSRGARTGGKSKRSGGGGGGGGGDKSVNRPKKEDRGRTSVLQTTLRSTLDLQHSTRSRPETPKRR